MRSSVSVVAALLLFAGLAVAAPLEDVAAEEAVVKGSGANGLPQVYISAGQSDTPGCGNVVVPCLTLTYALSILADGGTVYVIATGGVLSYPYPVTVSQNVNIVGFNGTAAAPATVAWSLLVTNTATVTITNMYFTTIYFSFAYPCIQLNVGSAAIITNTVFFSNMGSTINAISVDQGATITATSVTFLNSYQGVLFTQSTTQPAPLSYGTFKNVNFSATPAYLPYYYQQFGIAIQGPSVITLLNAYFGNVTYGLYFTTSSLNIPTPPSITVVATKAQFIGCRSGVAMYTSPNQPLTGVPLIQTTLNNCDFVENGGQIPTYPSAPALVMNQGSQVTITNSRFLHNLNTNRQNDWRGGAFFCAGESTLSLRGVDFEDNQAVDGGIGWCNSTCTVTAIRTVTKNNVEIQNTGPCKGLPN